MNRIEILLLCLAIATPASAAPPVPAITGPTTARTGDLIFLDASGSTATHFDWLVDTSGVSIPTNGAESAQSMAEKLRKLGFKVEPPKNSAASATYLVLDGGKKLLLASYPGTWRVSLAVGNSEGVKQLPWTLVVAGNGPLPPPPKPDDPKPPGPPPIKTDYSAEAKQWLATVPVASRNIITHKGLTVQKNLADTLNEVGMQADRAGSIAAMDILLEIGIKAVFKPLGPKAADWAKFAASADAVLNDLKSKGATPSQYGAALISIAKGIQ